jgi:PAS domain S-box-containing protein
LGVDGLIAPLMPTLVSGEALVRGAVVPVEPAVSPLVPVDGAVMPGLERMPEPDCTCARAEAESSPMAAKKRGFILMPMLLSKRFASGAAIGVPRYHCRLMNPLRFLAAALQRLVDKMDPQEGRYRMLFEHSPLPMWVIDIETLRFLGINAAAVELYGYSRDEFLSMSVQQVRLPEDGDSVRELVRREAGEVIRGAFRHVKKDGREIDVEAVGHLVNWRGRSARLVLLNDVTERNRTQQELERLNRELEDRVRSRTEQLEAANKELEAFSYSVSHDLRAPVRHIDGFVKLLERELPPSTEKTAHYLRTIAASSQRMAALIDDLLTLSRTGRAPLEMRSVPLRPLVDEVIVDLKPDIARRRIEWRIEALPTVRGDPSLLRVVLQNLLDNAVKYTRPQRGTVIEIGSRRLEDGETAVYVRDNGVGFDMRYADRLFGVFQRLHRADEFEGTGIGLATARRVVHRHGGRIWGDGEPGRGACFYFTVQTA